MNPPLRPEEWVVGCSVRLVTTLEEVMEGKVFAFDRLSNCVTLTTEGVQNGTLDFRIVKVSCVKSILSARRPETPADLTLPYLELTQHTHDPQSHAQPIQDKTDEELEKRIEEQREDIGRWEDDVEREEEMAREAERVKPAATRTVWGKTREAPIESPPPPERQSIEERTRRSDDPWGTKERSTAVQERRSDDPWGTKERAAAIKHTERRSDDPWGTKEKSRASAERETHETTQPPAPKEPLTRTEERGRRTTEPRGTKAQSSPNEEKGRRADDPWGTRGSTTLVERRPEDPWGTKQQQRKTEDSKPAEAPSVSNTVAESKGEERPSPAPSPVPAVSSVPTQPALKGPWGVKNTRITSKVPYSQVASSNVNQTPTTQPEAAKTGNGGRILTMNLKSRAPLRN